MFFFFSNISHLATFFYSPVQVVSGLKEGRWAGLQVEGVALIDQEEEELKGEVSTFDL